MAEKEPNAPKQFDPLKGTVYGNVLDKFDNYAYNIKLYMIPPTASPSGNEATPVAGTSARQTVGQPASNKASGQGGYLNNYYVAPPEETVILAQTGVTGAQIDNVQIVSAVGTGGAFFTSTVNFDIIQPGAANFIDQILATKKHIGAPIFAPDVPLFMEITFKGYDDDIDDPDQGGYATAIAGPYRYKLTIKNVAIEIDEKGSTYAFECVSEDQLPYGDQYYTLPCLMTVTGGTIEEYIKDLESKIKEYGEKNLTDYQFQDEILFDLSGILQKYDPENELAIADDKLTNNSEAEAEDLNRIMNPSLVGKTQEEYKEILKDDPVDSGKLDIVVGADTITFREGIKIDTAIGTILSMNDEFFSKTARSELADKEPSSKDKPFVSWYKLNADYEYGDYDEFRNTYSKRIMYKPLIYRTDGSNIQKSTDENQNLTKQEVQKRFDGMSIFKAYHYTYTGRNDQILNCRIAYNNGIALIVPPAGGATGDFSTTQASSLTTQAGADADLTGQDQAKAAEKKTNDKKANEFLGGLDNTDLASLGQWAGLTGAEITDLVNNKNGASRNLLQTALSNSNLLQAAQAAQEAGNLNTTSDNQKSANAQTYTDKASGYQYGADIVDSIASTLDAGMSQNAFKSKITNLRREAKNKKADGKDNSGQLDSGDTAQPQVQQIHLTNPAEAATYDGTTRNSIFGYLMQQHGASDFLVKLNMEIKGDPWYLGKVDDNGYGEPLEPSSADKDETNGDNAVYSKDENYVMFEMQLPRLYDFDVEDEDNNTGYWKPEGTSYFISGVYRMVTVVNNFSNGLYSTELDLNKLTPIKISMLEQLPPETNQENTQ